MTEIKQELNNKNDSYEIKFDDEIKQELREITLDEPVSKTLVPIHAHRKEICR